MNVVSVVEGFRSNLELIGKNAPSGRFDKSRLDNIDIQLTEIDGGGNGVSITFSYNIPAGKQNAEIKVVLSEDTIADQSHNFLRDVAETLKGTFAYYDFLSKKMFE